MLEASAEKAADSEARSSASFSSTLAPACMHARRAARGGGTCESSRTLAWCKAGGSSTASRKASSNSLQWERVL